MTKPAVALCSECKEEITEEQWDDRHWPHDVVCHMRDYTHVQEWPPVCACDNEVHPDCCWECQPHLKTVGA